LNIAGIFPRISSRRKAKHEETKSFPYISKSVAAELHKTPCPLFLLISQGSKEKANKKKKPFWKGYSPLHPRHLLKKVDENF
jgi:hypothetical protein